MALSSCARVEIKDSEWCGDLAEDGAICYHTMSDKVRELTKEQWDVERFGQLCATAQVFADWKVTIDKLCSSTKRCTYEEKKIIQDFYDKMDKFLSHASSY